MALSYKGFVDRLHACTNHSQAGLQLFVNVLKFIQSWLIYKRPHVCLHLRLCNTIYAKATQLSKYCVFIFNFPLFTLTLYAVYSLEKSAKAQSVVNPGGAEVKKLRQPHCRKKNRHVDQGEDKD